MSWMVSKTLSCSKKRLNRVSSTSLNQASSLSKLFAFAVIVFMDSSDVPRMQDVGEDRSCLLHRAKKRFDEF